MALNSGRPTVVIELSTRRTTLASHDLAKTKKDQGGTKPSQQEKTSEPRRHYGARHHATIWLPPEQSRSGKGVVVPDFQTHGRLGRMVVLNVGT